MKKQILFLVFLVFLTVAQERADADIVALPVKADLSKYPEDNGLWNAVKEETIALMAQPMVAPRPKKTITSNIKVQAIHDGKWIVFRLQWADPSRDEAGKLGEFSDAVAIEFPVKEGPPPPVFMGAKDNPVHLFHWRAQYQRDAEKGKKEMKDIYPNMSIDMYPLEFKDQGTLQGLTDEKREQYSHGKAAGNPQSYSKTGVDEIFAEGFSTSSVIENTESYGKGFWQDGKWTVIIGRHMNRENGSNLIAGKGSHLGFAVWQGQAAEVGSRKSVTMSWTPLTIQN